MTTPAPVAAAPKPDLAAEVDAKLEEAANNIVSWFDAARDDVKAKLVPVVSTAVKYQNSPVVQALEEAALGPVGEQMVAGWIRDVAKITGVPETPAGIDAQADTAPAAPPVPATA